MSTSFNGNRSTGLPNIPSFPPIEIPNTSNFRSSVDHLPPLDEDSHLSFTSLSPPPYHVKRSDGTPQPSPTSASSLSPNLRKAFSVDSFSRPSRSPVNVSSRQRGVTSAALAVSDDHRLSQVSKRQTLESPYVPRDPGFSLSGRSRGPSFSTTGDEGRPSIPEESNGDVVRDIPTSTGTKRTKIRGKLRPTLPPGELPLPSRLHGSNPATVGVSSGSGSNDGTPRLPAATIEDLLHRKSKAGPSNRPSRGDPPGLGSTSNTASTEFGITMLQSVTVAVIGEKGCGKSTAIAKGLKAYKLTEPVIAPDSTEDHRYTLREGRVVDEHGADAVLNVLEVDAAVLRVHLESNRAAWPEQAPHLDGVIVCCNVSKKDSFTEVEDVLPAFRAARLPIVALACKCDLENLLDLKRVHEQLSIFDIGLVKVTISNETGKSRLRLAFDWLLRAINHNRRTDHFDAINYQNPASPEVLTATPPWEIQRSDTATPIAAMNMSSDHSQVPPSHDPSIHSTSSMRIRSTGDLPASSTEAASKGVPDHDKSQDVLDGEARPCASATFPGAELTSLTDSAEPTDDLPEDRPGVPERDSRYVPWATLDELLDRLLFLAISDDDWGFISHFLLTYRRFANPRSLILAMQKRMRQLDQGSDDPMFACFAQMRICHLLEVWIQDYPHDFVVGAAADALNALIKSIVTKTHLLHYGSDLLPFLEGRPLHDKDSAWALKADEPTVENDDFEDDDDDVVIPMIEPSSTQTQLAEEARSTRTQLPGSSGERKSSFPARSSIADQADSVTEVLKTLLITSARLGICEPLHVAEEITRVGKRMFLLIEPRDWLHHVLVSGKKDPEINSIARFNEMSEHLADWVVSLVLCHDKPKNRAKQIEKLVEIAEKLRAHNNYSALRAFVAGINSATYPGDPVIAKFQENNPKLHKHLQSWELLFNSTGSHRTYRMALRNSKGPCIPALEVHLSDLIRAHVGNGDTHPEDSSKIHWAKFNMMGRFVHLVKKYQLRCRDVEDGYSFEERPDLQGLLNVPIMHNEMQLSRIAPPLDAEEPRDYSDRRDAALIRKLKFWV